MNHKTRKKYMAVLMALAMILSAAPLIALAGPASPFAGGDGSSGNPYQVADQAQLDAVRGYLGSCFIQVTDITITSANWTPIGDAGVGNRFTGSYNGGGYKIKGLKIDITTPMNSSTMQGLFGVVGVGGVISNVNLENVDIDVAASTGPYESFIGGLAGESLGTISGCSVTGTLNAAAYDIAAGGLVGSVGGSQQIGSGAGSVTGCTSACTLNIACTNQTAHAGGLVGEIFTTGSSVSNSTSSGTVTCRGGSVTTQTGPTAGGLIGYAGGGVESGIEIENCSSDCAVYALNARSQANAGGLIGCVSGKCIISGCSSTGNAEATGSTGAAGVQVDAGGLIGWSTSSSVITNCYSTGDATASGTGTTSYDDFYSGGFLGYSSSGTISFSRCYALGNATTTANTYGYAFAGGFGGYFTSANADKCYSKGNAQAVSASGYASAGGFTGYYKGTGSMQNCFSTGNASAECVSRERAGGLSGVVEGATVSHCYSTGIPSVAHMAYLPQCGGLVGVNNAGTISGSYYDSTVSGKTDSDRGTPKPSADMKDPDFVTSLAGAGWKLVSNLNSGYPVLDGVGLGATPTALVSYKDGADTSTTYGTDTVARGIIFSQPTWINPSKADSSLTGWYTDSSCESTYKWNFAAQSVSGTAQTLFAGWEAAGDTTAPGISNGELSVHSLTQTGLLLTWSKALDTVSAQSALAYLVYMSDSNNLGSVADIEANGTAIGVYAADIATKNVTGLSMGTTYYFNVIVKDEAGNKACYTAKSAATLPPADITSAGIINLTVPVTGSVPITVSCLSAYDTGIYTVTSLDWQNGDGYAVTLTSGGVFKANFSYQAVIVLTSAAGYKFPSAGLTPFLYPGTPGSGTPQSGTVSGGDVSGNTLTFIVTFQDTGAKAVTGIAVKTQPSDLNYEYGETLNLAGLEATVSYSDESSLDVAFNDFGSNGITANPADGTVLAYASHNGHKVVISCGGYSAETDALTVGPQEIAAAGVTGIVAPVTGGSPYFSVYSGDSSKYYVSSTWLQNEDGTDATLSSEYTCLPDSSYRLEIVLVAQKGYRFPPSGLLPTVNAGTPQMGTTSSWLNLSLLKFYVIFPVTSPKELIFILNKTAPNDLYYENGEKLNLEGLVAVLCYNDNSSVYVDLADFASYGITVKPAEGTVMDYATHNGYYLELHCGKFAFGGPMVLTVNPPTPILAAGTVNRTSDQAALVKFTSDQAGTYYFGIVADGAGAPDISIAGPGNVCLTGDNAVNLTTLTAGDWDLYLQVKSKAGKVSEALKMDIAAYFVPVTGISDIPDLAWAGTARTLTGTVSPEDATNRMIVWSVKNAGATGAQISGSTFTATGTGTAVLTAAIEKGASPAGNYTQDFSIEVHPAMVNKMIEHQVDSSTAIVAEGVLAEEAQLIVVPIANGDAERVELEEQLSEQNAIAAYEVHVEPAEAFQPPLTLTFQLGEQYNGRTVYILHRLSNGSTDVYTPTVTNGQAVITVYELSPFLLAVDPQVTIQTQPQSVLALVNQTAAFHVEAEGLDPLSYRWQRRTGLNAAWEDIAGASSPGYTTAALNLSHNGYQYRVIVSDVLGNTVTSDAAVLTVTETPGTGDDSKPLAYAVMAVLFAAAAIIILRKRRMA